ncbi:Na(+)/H(+) antiporter subunit B [Parvibaculum sp.]|uniref:Na(+)/H(+) antiporter subunit B n=1 Tax=Parvibaculum sp. TaxID=2024848 RepID=UPI00271F53A8|nr:Na(+)/H(+) antiporter subunit B [Parvibaculum sp.]MDO9128073.1 Na(+)/H(+) antiporter subunit B [Parvibaculum sp.]MDP1628200.1 Na(+)/H(+) antiporter subunit B [Parvibaculum sp.]MDP2148040.1 Na(+)/H(+) antiporter subunit B [Parvibaculum sp.]MDP3326888.1 Na(+)/H(+) antiporter subunit B [Parvibaculum sp.]
MEHHSVLRVVSKLLIPPIILYALYVQWHGDYGPGGGFQAGVLFAVAFILYALVFGIDSMMKVLPPRTAHIFAGAGVLIYAGTGIVTMLLGDAFLGYNALAHDPVHAQEWGILAVEFGVGVSVAAVMIALFVAFARHNPPLKDEDW